MQLRLDGTFSVLHADDDTLQPADQPPCEGLRLVDDSGVTFGPSGGR